MTSTIHTLRETCLSMEISMTGTLNHTQDKTLGLGINLIIQNIQGTMRKCINITEKIDKLYRGQQMYQRPYVAQYDHHIKNKPENKRRYEGRTYERNWDFLY